MGEIIRLENVVKMYENSRRAINDVSFTINEHESICVYGASGSGKTSLMKLIAGIEAPSDGSIYVKDKEVHNMDSDTAADFRNQNFGILARHHGLLDSLTVFENVTMPLAIRKVAVAKRRLSAMEQLKTLGIAHLANAYPPQLSNMELQLAGVGRALVGEPNILLVANIDSRLTKKEQEKLYGLLYAIWKFSELTLIRFTDRENSGLPYDRHFCLEFGKITEDIK